MAENM